MPQLVHFLEEIPNPSVLHSTSALDTYFEAPESSVLHVYTEADLIQLAKVAVDIEFPGVDGVDALLQLPEGRIRFTCVDSTRHPPRRWMTLLNFLYDPHRRVFMDPYGAYDGLRQRRLDKDAPSRWAGQSRAKMREPEGSAETNVSVEKNMVSFGFRMDWRTIAEAALIIARYDFSREFLDDLAVTLRPSTSNNPSLPPILQRDLLTQILEGSHAKRSFQLLKSTGFIEAHWPELVTMYDVGHSKEHHPEGDVWQHTLETFGYRKTADLVLGLGLLFHDSGKPMAKPAEGRLFDRHSQIGARLTERFLRRLEFEGEIVRKAVFLVREHMLPSFIPELPTYRTEEVMASDLFPLLLELYRCDLSSTYRGPEGYYKACKIYRSFQKNLRNPYRHSDGRKIAKRGNER